MHLSPGRLMAELEVEEVDHPGGLGLGGQRRRFVGGHAERLVAQHGVSGRDGEPYVVGVEERGRVHGDQVDVSRQRARTAAESLAETTSTTSHPIWRKIGATTRAPKPAPTTPIRSGRRSPVVDPDVSMVPPLAVPRHPTRRLL